MLVEILRNRAFHKLTPVAERSIVALDKAKTVGLLIDASEKDIMVKLNAFVSFLRGKLITYQILCIDLGLTPDTTSLSKIHSPAELCVIRPINIPHKRVGIPSADSIKTFVSRPFDMLLDLTTQSRSVTSDYIAAASRAKMKVCYSSKESDIYDVVLSPKAQITTQELIKYTIDYLTSF